MTNTPDLTSPEAVERLAQMHAIGGGGPGGGITAATLRALAAERDALKAEAVGVVGGWKARAEAADAALEEEQRISTMRGNKIEFDLIPALADTEAELTELKAELAEAVEVIVIAQALIDPCYPSQHGDWQREARAFIARHQKEADT